MLIPQEILEEIIGHLHTDIETLKCCAMAARPLYPASRQHMFSTIRLLNLSDISKLHRLLESSPDMSSLVRTLQVHPRHNETLLPTLLPRLSHLQHLSIGSKRFRTNWKSIPVSTKNALKELMMSPTLRTLKLSVIFYLPISVFSLAARVKVLNVYLVALDGSDTGHQADPLDSMDMDSIELINFNPGINWVCPAMPHLRRCVFGFRLTKPLGTMQKVITSGAGSIEDVTWLEFEGELLDTDLGVISHLQRLNIVTRLIEHSRLTSVPFMWTSMSVLLASASLGDLQEFNITVEILPSVPLLLGINNDAYLGAADAWWNNLDALLGDPLRAPKLRVVNFMLHMTGLSSPHVSNTTFSSLVRERLPLLRDAGKLSTSLLQ